MPDDRDPRDRNFEAGFAATRAWATEHGRDPWPLIYRLAFAALTESGGRVYANAGAAFTAETQWSAGMPPDKRAGVAAVLASSLRLPHDAVGRNGGSTGWLQQLSRDYVTAALNASWGWGSIPETMDVAKSTRMFLDALTVTDDPVYVPSAGAPVRLSDPIAADVLRVQRPLYSEAASGNYGAERVAQAKRLVDTWHPSWFTDGGSL